MNLTSHLATLLFSEFAHITAMPTSFRSGKLFLRNARLAIAMDILEKELGSKHDQLFYRHQLIQEYFAARWFAAAPLSRSPTLMEKLTAALGIGKNGRPSLQWAKRSCRTHAKFQGRFERPHLIAVSGGFLVLFRLKTILAAVGLSAVFEHGQQRLPFVVNWLIKRQIQQFYFLLGILLEDGLPFADALPKAIATIDSGELRSLISRLFQHFAHFA